MVSVYKIKLSSFSRKKIHTMKPTYHMYFVYVLVYSAYYVNLYQNNFFFENEFYYWQGGLSFVPF